MWQYNSFFDSEGSIYFEALEIKSKHNRNIACQNKKLCFQKYLL